MDHLLLDRWLVGQPRLADHLFPFRRFLGWAGTVHSGTAFVPCKRCVGQRDPLSVGQLLDEHWIALSARGECDPLGKMSIVNILTKGSCEQATGVLPAHSIYTHFPELAAWLAVLAVFTWSCVRLFSSLLGIFAPTNRFTFVQAFASLARDAILASVLFSLAIGTTIACCLFATGTGVHVGIVVAAYFWMLSALLAWWRVTVYLVEEAYGPDSVVTKFFPIFRTRLEKRAPLVMPGLGEPGVKRGVPKLVAANFGHDDDTDAQGYTKDSATAAPIDVSTNGATA